MSQVNEYDDIDDFFCNELPHADDDAFNTNIAVPVTLFGKTKAKASKCESEVRDNTVSPYKGEFNEKVTKDTRYLKKGRQLSHSEDEVSVASLSSTRSRSSSSSSESLSLLRRTKKLRPRRSEQIQEDNDTNSDTNKFLAEMEREAALVSVKQHSSSKNEARGSQYTSNRVYNIGFISRLSGTSGKKIIVKTTGDKKFLTMLPIALSTFVKQYRVSRTAAQKYKMDDIKIYRDGVEVFKFMTCDSLNISESGSGSATDIEMYIVPNQDAEAFTVEWKKKYEERVKYLSGFPVNLENNVNKDDNDDFRVNEYEEDLANARSLDESEILDKSNTSLVEPILQIALLGSDNKKIYVKVKPSTTFNNVGNHYRNAKGLPSSSKIVLSFDNEELDSSSTVADADIEDDDIIEVTVV
ncbi:HHR065Wp [Eremothecium sinecaudum]|uniref:HHR065Wp n=1 Tax=Eremothecium sinecaudum TaxID=45286 RepID=A0A0X8HWL4_9SACH|nr:HHR065Wp [Eremothecium sinecaudum]AMD22834.1 HHR065Wp [Eremothecium sinecaudum]